MKTTIISCVLAITALSACNTENSNKTQTTDTVKPAAVNAVAPPSAGTDVTASSSIKGIVDGYLNLKNALAADNAKDAATAGSEIMTAMAKIDQSAMTAEQKKKYADLADDIKEHAEHISTNAGKIAHQREHFEMLSTDIYDLVKAFGGGRTLYKDFCPMYNDKKGAFWVSETKDIKNPYLGKEMATCGSVKEEIK